MEITSLFNVFMSSFITLILVLDPFGNIPATIAVLPDVPKHRRKFFIFRESCIATVLLLLFMFFGKGFLALIHLKEHSLQISGGIILFIISLEMIFPKKDQRDSVIQENNQSKNEPFIFPLAVPFIAGPSSMATTMLISSAHIYINALALITATTATMITLFFSEFVYQKIGEATMNAIVRLMGLLLSTISVQMILSGVHGFIQAS